MKVTVDHIRWSPMTVWTFIVLKRIACVIRIDISQNITLVCVRCLCWTSCARGYVHVTFNYQNHPVLYHREEGLLKNVIQVLLFIKCVNIGCRNPNFTKNGSTIQTLIHYFTPTNFIFMILDHLCPSLKLHLSLHRIYNINLNYSSIFILQNKFFSSTFHMTTYS